MRSTMCHVSRVAIYFIIQISNESENESWPYLLMYQDNIISQDCQNTSLSAVSVYFALYPQMTHSSPQKKNEK